MAVQTRLHAAFIAMFLVGGVVVKAKSWKPVGLPTRSVAAFTHLTVHPNGTPLLVYRTFTPTPCSRCIPDESAYCLIYTHPGVGWLHVGMGLGRVDSNSPQETRLALNPASGITYIAFRDEGAGGQLSLKRWNQLNGTWQFCGAPGASVGVVSGINAEYHQKYGSPVMCYQDADDGGKANCLRFISDQLGFRFLRDGSATGFTPAAADFVSMAVRQSTGNIYVAYQDFSSTSLRGRVRMWDYNSAKWVTLGPHFSSGQASTIAIAVQPSTGQPWVAFKETPTGVNGTGDSLSVVRWTGTAWVSVGPAGFAGPGSQYASLAFDPASSAAWLAYQCDSVARKLCVRTWANGAWQLRGPQGVSKGTATFITLRFHKRDTPFVAFTDEGQNSRGVLMKWV